MRYNETMWSAYHEWVFSYDDMSGLWTLFGVGSGNKSYEGCAPNLDEAKKQVDKKIREYAN